MAHLLLAMDNRQVRCALIPALGDGARAATVTGPGIARLCRMVVDPPDLVLDLLPPGTDGGATLGPVTTEPAIMAARGDERSVVEVVAMSAEGHRSQPSGAVHLPARVRAVLRRGTGDQPPGQVLVTVAETLTDPAERRTCLARSALQVTAREFDRRPHLTARIVAVAAMGEPLADVGYQPCDCGARAVEAPPSSRRRKLGENRWRHRHPVGFWATVPAAA